MPSKWPEELERIIKTKESCFITLMIKSSIVMDTGQIKITKAQSATTISSTIPFSHDLPDNLQSSTPSQHL